MADIGIRVIVAGTAEARRNVAAVNADMQRLGSTITALSGASNKLGSDLISAGTALSGLGRTLTLTVTAPLIAAFGALVAAGVQFEDAFAGVGKTVEGVMTPMGELTTMGQRLRDEFRQMALELPIATNEIAALGEVVGQLGVRAQDVAKVTELMAQLGATTNLSAEEAAKGIIRFGNIMEGTALDVEDFTRRAGSAIVALGNASVSTESEILNLALRLAAAGDRADFSSQQVLAWATTLSDVGVRAELGGTAVSRAITEMILAIQTGSGSFEVFARVVGKTTSEFARAFKEDASAALLEFIAAMEEGIRTGRVTEDMLVEMGLSGVRTIDVLGRLGNVTDLFEGNLRTANSAWEEQLALQEEFNKRAATVKSKLQILINRFSELGIKIFDLVREPLVRLIEGLGHIVDAIVALDPKITLAILGFGGIAAAIGPLLILLGGAISVLGTIATIIGGLLTPVGLLAAGLAGIGTALLLAFGPELKAAIQPTLDTIKLLFEFLAGGGIPQAPEPIEPKTGPGGIMSEETPTISLSPEQVAAMMKLREIREAFTELQITVQEKVNQIQKSLQDLVQSDALTTFKEAIVGTFQAVRTAVLGVPEQLEILGEKIATLAGQEGFADILEGLSGFGNILKSIVLVSLETLTTTALPQLQAAFVQFTEALNKLGLDWGDVLAAFVTAVTDIVLVIAVAFTLLVVIITTAINIIASVINGVATAINSAVEIFKLGISAIGNIIRGVVVVAQGVIQFFQGDFRGGIFTVFQGIGTIVIGILQLIGTAIAGFLNGVQFAVNIIIGSVSGLVTSILEFFGSILVETGAITQETVDQIIEKFGNLRDGALEIISSIVDGVTGFFQNLSNVLVGASIIPDMVENILGSIRNLKTEFLKLAEEIVTGVINSFGKIATLIGDIIGGILGGGEEGGGFLFDPAVIEEALLGLQETFTLAIETLSLLWQEFLLNLELGFTTSMLNMLNSVMLFTNTAINLLKTLILNFQLLQSAVVLAARNNVFIICYHAFGLLARVEH